MLKIKHYRTERLSLFSALINAESGDFLVSIFFRHRELKALFIFSSHCPLVYLTSYTPLIALLMK